MLDGLLARNFFSLSNMFSLKELESRIDPKYFRPNPEWEDSFLKTCVALHIIVREKLYKPKSVGDYFRQRWSASRAHGYNLATAGKVLDELQKTFPRNKLPSGVVLCLAVEKWSKIEKRSFADTWQLALDRFGSRDDVVASHLEEVFRPRAASPMDIEEEEPSVTKQLGRLTIPAKNVGGGGPMSPPITPVKPVALAAEDTMEQSEDEESEEESEDESEESEEEEEEEEQPIVKKRYSGGKKKKPPVILDQTHQTFPAVAAKVIEHFKPSGKCLEPARGNGAFYDLLPEGSDWCELAEGVDFLAQDFTGKHYDWIVSNPPYQVFTEFLRKSFEIADNVIFLCPENKAVNSSPRIALTKAFGGIKETYRFTEQTWLYKLGMPVAAIHWQRGYSGPVYYTSADEPTPTFYLAKQVDQFCEDNDAGYVDASHSHAAENTVLADALDGMEIAEYERLLVLVSHCPNRAWCRDLFSTGLVCFLSKSPHKCLVYLDVDAVHPTSRAFCDVFGKHGIIPNWNMRPFKHPPPSKIRYLSLFSGIGAAELAIQRVFPDAECLGFSEIDKAAIKVYHRHFPDHPNLGDITEIDADSLPDVDLIVGGSPCQGFSIQNCAREGNNFDDPRSELFFEFVRILKAKKPRWFVFENVPMNEEVSKEISEQLGVQPVLLNASHFSAQVRKRNYWTNFYISQPVPRPSPKVEDIVEKHVGRATALKWKELKHKPPADLICGVSRSRPNGRVEFRTDGKTNCLTTVDSYESVVVVKGMYRLLTCLERERLQGFPDSWTACVPAKARKRLTGNSFQVDAFEYVLKHI